MCGKQIIKLKQIENDYNIENSYVIEVDVHNFIDYAILQQNYQPHLNPYTKMRFLANDNTRVSLRKSI
jgi:hypothetical protein